MRTNHVQPEQNQQPKPLNDGRSHAPDCSPALLDPKDAPKDGTMILAAVGWPWLAPAMWCEYAEEWVIAVPQVDYLHGSSVRHFENDTEPKISGWLPIPPLPGGYVFRPENTGDVAPPPPSRQTTTD